MQVGYGTRVHCTPYKKWGVVAGAENSIECMCA